MFQDSVEPWFVYIAQCMDGSLYTGITQNVQKRIERHNSGRGALHVRAHGPLKLLWTEQQSNLSAARRREMQLKGWTRRKKLALAKGDLELLTKL
jgi:putative endonuclease